MTMVFRSVCFALVALFLIARVDAGPFVPATSDPWLAGMPDGSTASGGDVAPFQSPVLWPSPVFGGQILSLTATGKACNVSVSPFCFGGDDPNGNLTSILTHYAGAENGISNITAPADALIGVFLGSQQPDLTPAPAALDFSSAASRDYLTLAPALKQVFFIGTGLTSANQLHQITVPIGATRFFLGTMDGYDWTNNTGGFTINGVPEPGGVALSAAGLILLGIRAIVFRLRG